ncbi:MAG TPA: hypothetical protein DCF68_09260 [Cyanothece sp. UBA12306]|nr:hypothetical protein [Cyanothece sp. UBA12306]
MTNQFIRSLESESEQSRQSLQEELLELLLDEEEVYPWDPTSLEAEAYFSEIEAEFSLIDALDEAEMTNQADLLFSNIGRCWSSVNHPKIPRFLLHEFAQLVPLKWLETITTQAELLATKNLSRVTQLVECVKPLWTNWMADDLEVFARPLTYAMGGEYNIKPKFWQELSEIEQIRLSMSIAQKVFNQLTPKKEE